VAGPAIVHDVVDGEAVVLHMSTGLYYSLQGVAAEIWQAACARHSVDAIVQDVARRYSGDGSAIRAAVEEFLVSLERETLLIPSEPVPSEPGPEVGTKPEFEAPRLLRYDDMDDLLLLDPVHDTDAAGWPSAKKTPPIATP
jgi:hypothetical protein